MSTSRSKEGDLHILGPHDAILYNGDDVAVQLQSANHSETLDDSFFELNLHDIQRRYSELKAKVKELEESPLQTKSARDLEKEVRTLRLLHDYPTTVLRIRFQNRFILQGTFRTMDTISSVYQWLQDFLQNPQLKFYLFTAPPKTILEKENSQTNNRLFELGLVGMAVLYFGSDDPTAPDDQKVLKPEYYQKVSRPDAAYDFVHKKLERNVTPTNEEEGEERKQTEMEMDGDPEGQASGSRQRRVVQQQQQPRSSGGGHVPKWFKTNNKK